MFRFRLANRVASIVVAAGLAACAPGASTGTNGPVPLGRPNAEPQSAQRSATSSVPVELSSNSVAASTSVTRLGAYHVSPKKIFVAGISSGGFFAVQMHAAHSRIFKGAAIYAGGVYHCAQDSVELALADCGGETVNGQALYMSTLAQSETYLDQQAALGTIDPERDLQGQPVYLWSGTNDSVVNPKEMADLNTEYRHYGANVRFDNAFPANHGWESPTGEVPAARRRVRT